MQGMLISFSRKAAFGFEAADNIFRRKMCFKQEKKLSIRKDLIE